MISRKEVLPLLCSLLLLAGGPGLPASDEIPGAPQDHPIALIGGTVHTISGETIAGGTVLFDKGRITAVGLQVELPEGTEPVDVRGKHVYPGLFDAYTNLGLVEVNSIRATRDESETGNLNPNVRAEVAVNPDSELIPVARSNGVLLALTAPTGGILSGQSAVLQLDGWTWEDMTVRSGAGMHIRWPLMSPVSDWWIEKSAKDQIQERDKQLEILEEIFKQARLSMQDPQEEPGDLRLEAMIPVLQGRQPIIVAANSLSQIQAAVAFAARQKVRLVIFGGYDAPACSALLKQHDVPVIVGSVYRLPRRRGDDYDAAFTLPARLHQAGIPFCIASNGRFGASNIRNLPYHAATAVAFGLPADEAIKAITLSPARILGVEDRVGSIAAGRDATLIVTSGDPLETTTHVERAFVQGRQVDLSNKQTRLWQKYRTKYQQQRDAAGEEGP
jgi:imidazolonepropionase-like amidohydrolase